jgi:hypothetical protein
MIGVRMTSASKQCSRIQLLKIDRQQANRKTRDGNLRRISFSARDLHRPRHDARLIPAQYVKPYRKMNESDYIGAKAVADVRRPTMRFVPIKLGTTASAGRASGVRARDDTEKRRGHRSAAKSNMRFLRSWQTLFEAAMAGRKQIDRWVSQTDDRR